MNKILDKVRFGLRQLLSRLPSPPPKNAAEFDAWSKDLLELAGLDCDDLGLKFDLARCVAQEKYAPVYRSKRYYVKSLRVLTLLQLSMTKIQALKEEQTKKLAEATAKPTEAPSANEQETKAV